MESLSYRKEVYMSYQSSQGKIPKSCGIGSVKHLMLKGMDFALLIPKEVGVLLWLQYIIAYLTRLSITILVD